jgi:hypothetical protein
MKEAFLIYGSSRCSIQPSRRKTACKDALSLVSGDPLLHLPKFLYWGDEEGFGEYLAAI